jgi:translin
LSRDLNRKIHMLVRDSYEFLRRQEDAKYELLKKISEALKKCRQSLKASYAQDFLTARRLLDDVQKDVKTIVKTASKKGIQENWPPIVQTYQELMEAVFMYGFMSKRSYRLRTRPPPASILYAASDLIGELKRVMMECLRRGLLKEAEETYGEMAQLYENLSTIALGDAALPGFKRKIDVNRASVESAFVILNEELRRKAFLSSIEEKIGHGRTLGK